MQGSLWRLRIWAPPEPSGLAAVSRLAARGRAAPPKGLEGEKVFSHRTYSAPTLPVRCRHIAAGEDGHHPGRARQSARPPSARRITAQQPHRIVTGRAAALRPFPAHIGARVTTRKFRRQTEADTFRPPPKAFFLSGSLRDAFFWQDKRKRPSEKGLLNVNVDSDEITQTAPQH